MVNPQEAIPNFDSLPSKTQKAILKRKDIGVLTRDYGNDLAGNLDKILGSDFLKSTKAAVEILGQLPEEVRLKIDSRRITDLLVKETRKSKIEKLRPLPGTGKKVLFQLKEFVNK